MHRSSPSPVHRLVVASAAVLLGLLGAAVTPGREDGGTVGVWAQLPDGVASDELQVLVDGEPRRATTDDASGEPRWRVAVVFDQLLSDPRDVRNAAVLLAEQAPLLTRLGPVEVVLAGETIRSALPPTREAPAVAEALSWIRIRESAEDRQAEVRREVQGAFAGVDDRQRVRLVEAALREEAALLRRQWRNLLRWAAERPSDPGLLLLVSTGFDVDPAPYYRSLLEGAGGAALWELVEAPAAADNAGQVGAALSVLGWSVVPFVPAERGDALLSGEEPEGPDQQTRAEAAILDGRDYESTAITFSTSQLKKKGESEEGEEPAPPLRLAPREPLLALAAETGGVLATDSLRLQEGLEALPGRRWVGWERSGGFQESTDPRRVAIRAPDTGEEIPAPRWVGATTPEIVSAARATALLEEDVAEGELELDAIVVPGEAGEGRELLLEVRQGGGQPASDLAAIRLTLASGREDGAPVVLHHAPAARPDGRFAVDLPPITDSRSAVAVVLEDLASRRWGGSVATWIPAGAAVDAGESLDLLLPAPKAIHLMAPAENLPMGLVEFRTVVSDRRVERVDFHLDGEREAVRRSPPFVAELDLGGLPVAHRVEVVARDGGGAEVGRDVLLLNSGGAGLTVRLETPGREREPGGGVDAEGHLDVEVRVQGPRNVVVHRVDLYWRDRLEASLFAPPYRHRVEIPTASPRGFVRAVAYLADGSASEDVLFVNSPGSSERLQVTLVQFYVVVSDRDGRPVRDLTRDVFRIAEEGEPQEIATFGEAGDLPITVGLSIDSSASMFVKLPEVQLAAGQFLRSLLRPQDRGFVVGFGGEPRLARGTMSDLPELVRGIHELEPEGPTSIWKGIVYSLVQLQGSPGNKALIVYSDGADEDPDFPYKTARRFARLVGIPVYVILSNNEIVRTGGRGLNVKGFLGRLRELVDEVGGRVFLTRVGQDLDGVYRQIADEIRSQYVIGYYATQSPQTEWRRVKVEVDVPGLETRTAAGYFR